MKASIELNLENGVYGFSYELPGGPSMHGRGYFDLKDNKAESIASGFKEANWMLTASVLNEIRSK
jgi:hypothetical protein